MSAIKTFVRSLAQAFGISSPQQLKPQPLSRPLKPAAHTPNRPQAVKTAKKDE